jgi:hypothetical protein
MVIFHSYVTNYPLVNCPITMENHHAINGKIHYFTGHGFHSYVTNYQKELYPTIAMFRRVKSPRKNPWEFPMKSSNQVSPRRRPSKGKGLRLRASESWMDENWIIHLWMRTGSQMTCRKPSKYGHSWKFMKIRIWSHDRYERQVNTIHRRTRPTHSCGFVCLRIENRKPPAADLNTWQDIGIWFWYANFLLAKEWLDLLYSKKCTISLHWGKGKGQRMWGPLQSSWAANWCTAVTERQNGPAELTEGQNLFFGARF